MPRKAFGWFIVVAGLSITAIAVIYLFGLKEQYSLDDTTAQISYFAGLAVLVVGIVGSWRLARWWDKR